MRPSLGGAEKGGDGGHLWKDCYFGPRPGTSQWQGGEGFMFNATSSQIVGVHDQCAEITLDRRCIDHLPKE